MTIVNFYNQIAVKLLPVRTRMYMEFPEKSVTEFRPSILKFYQFFLIVFKRAAAVIEVHLFNYLQPYKTILNWVSGILWKGIYRRLSPGNCRKTDVYEKQVSYWLEALEEYVKSLQRRSEIEGQFLRRAFWLWNHVYILRLKWALDAPTVYLLDSAEINAFE